MEIKGNYNPLGMQIEGEIRKEYEDAFKSLRQCNSYQENLGFIASMFGVLEKSCPDRGKGVDWAKDMIEAYRTVGKIFRKMESEGNSEIKELSGDYECLLKKFYVETDKEKIDEALRYLEDIDKTLKEYNIIGKTELDSELENLVELRERSENLEELENLEKKVEDFENIFD